MRVQDDEKTEGKKTKQKWIRVETSMEQQVDEMHTTFFFLTIRHEIKHK